LFVICYPFCFNFTTHGGLVTHPRGDALRLSIYLKKLLPLGGSLFKAFF